MEEPTKFRKATQVRTIVSTISIAEIIKFLPENTDLSSVDIKARDYSVLVIYPSVERNTNYEADMEKYQAWKLSRISELEAELKSLRPSPGRLPDDND